MFGLFGKKKSQDPAQRLAECEKKKDWVALARAYYDLGVAAMDRGALEEAAVWLHRADTIYGAKDEVFEKAGKDRLFHPGIVDDCSQRIGALEDASILYNTLPAEVEEKAEELNDAQVRVWSLLSVARLVKLSGRLGQLPGCQVLGRLGWAVDRMAGRDTPSQAEYQQMMDICNGLYELGDSEAFYAGGELSVTGGAPFQVFDLNGMGVLLELNGFLDSYLRLLAARSQGAEDLPDAECGAVGCAVLPDYYVRTRGGKAEDAPQVKAELQRIWSDFEFVRSGPAREQVEERVAGYRQLDVLA